MSIFVMLLLFGVFCDLFGDSLLKCQKNNNKRNEKK